MNICSFIPARSGSKSIKDKNIRVLGGKPLIQWTIEASLKCGLKTVVSSDSKKYLELAKKLGAETLVRSSKLAKDDTPMFSVLCNEIPRIKPFPTIVVLMQPTSPFREIEDVKSAIDIFKKSKNSSLITVEDVPEKYNPDQVIIKTKTGYRIATGCSISDRITNRHDFFEAYIPTGSLYIFRTENLKKYDNFYGQTPMIFKTKPTININSKDDFIEAGVYYSSV